MNISKDLDNSIFQLVGDAAVSIGQNAFIVGGYVRDIFLKRPSKDIDFVTVGSGIDLAHAVEQKLGKGAHLSVFATYGTAQVKRRGLELEFVGARRESYQSDSRNPIVENGTLDDDLARRDFTINAMAVSVTPDSFGELLDPFNGLVDLHRKIIRTPLEPGITFSDDPLRMMRAIRFATQLNFQIYPETLRAIKDNAERIRIITKERINDELSKIIRSPRPSLGFYLLEQTGLLSIILPELALLKGVETVDGRGHKDNFAHTLQVVDNVAAKSENEWLRWAALFHDIAKPATKKYETGHGWTFHNHNFIGEKMIPRIFKRMRMPQNEKMKYVAKLVGMHMRPQSVGEDRVTDSAIRRMMFEAGTDIEDLMTLAEADITSKNAAKVRRILENFQYVRERMAEIEEKDRLRTFQPPVDGLEIMQIFGLGPCNTVGDIKETIKDAILDGKIHNDRAEAIDYMMCKTKELGLEPVISPDDIEVMKTTEKQKKNKKQTNN